MAFNPNFANRDVANLIFYNYLDKKPFMYFDRANATATGLTADRVWATGGQGGSPRVGFDGNAGGTLTIETQITPMKLYEMVSGNEATETAIYPVREIVKGTTETSNVVVTCSETPMAGTIYVYAIGDEGGASMVGTVTDKKVIVTGGAAGTDYVLYYMVTNDTDVATVTFKSDKFPKAFIVYGDTWYRSEEDEIVAVNLAYYKAMPQRNITLSYANSGDPSSVSIVFDLFADDNNNIWSISAHEQ